MPPKEDTVIMLAWTGLVWGWGGWVVGAASLGVVVGLAMHHRRDHRRWARQRVLGRLGLWDE
jgi:hypothetical protein